MRVSVVSILRMMVSYLAIGERSELAKNALQHVLSGVLRPMQGEDLAGVFRGILNGIQTPRSNPVTCGRFRKLRRAM